VEISFYSLTGPLVTWLVLVWIERNLKEKERLAKQVQMQSEQLANLTAVSADAIFSLDANGRITSWNRGAVQMLGYNEHEVLGKPFAFILPDAGDLTQQLEKHGIVQDYETAAHAKNGRFLTVNLSQTQLKNDSDMTSASLIIMRDVTAQREREAVLEEERARIARDLHDGVAQTLYFMALKADMLKQKNSQLDEANLADLQEIGQKARQVIREVRRTIFALRPLDWKQGNFHTAIRQFITDFSEQVGWQTAVHIDEHITIPPHLEPTIYRLIQESLNNVAKHANATEVHISLTPRANADHLLLEIKDNGIGFDTEAPSGSGFGLSQMQARVTAVDGTLHIHSQPANGTTIQIQLPLKRGSHE
jgi:PAS domain S-box-containing protein